MTEQIILVKPSIEYEQELLTYKTESLKENIHIHGGNRLDTINSITEYLEHLSNMESKDTVPKGLVPSTTLIAVKEASKEMVGIIDIRHELNESLFNSGGHIGYSIRPKYRNQSYGKMMLKLALNKCADLGLDRVLIICDADNIASAKVAISCGGVEEFTEISINEKIRRFWIRVDK